MFFHHFKYTFKTLLKSKSLIFWTFAFPILLGIFFHLAFANIEEKETFNPISIAVVETKELEENTMLQEAIKEVSDSTSSFQAFITKYVSLDEAKKLLDNNEITGYLLYENQETKIIVNSSSTNATIMKSVIDEINETIVITNELIKNEITINNQIDYKELQNKISTIISSSEANLKNTSNSNLSYTTIEYYTLIAMTCLYGGIISMTSINMSLANMSSKGKRISISPTKKSAIVLSSLLASYIVELCGTFLLIAFLYFILKVDFGSSLPHCILLSIVGSLAGLSLGLFTGTIFKTNENGKIGIIIAISMACTFLSGMMGANIKYYIDKFLPLINLINPASMITDAFYSLYYYNTLNRYYFNIICLLSFSFILIFISCLVLRRQKYDSI